MYNMYIVKKQKGQYPLCASTHVDSLLRCTDVLVAEVSGVDEATESILQTCPHSNALTGAAPVVKVLPHL